MRKLYLGILILLSCLFVTQTAFAQKNSIQVKRADNFYKQFDFRTALEIYQVASKKNEENLYVKGRIGNCYKFLNEIQNAADAYGSVATSEGTDPIYKFYYAQALMSNGKYEDALGQLNNYYAAIGSDKNISYYPSDLFTEDARYSIKIEDFNSKHADFSPFQIKDELFFISNRDNDSYISREDVWSDRPFTQIYKLNKPQTQSAEKTDSTETKSEKPRLFNKSSITKRYHEGPLTWDKSKNDIYFTRTNYAKNKAVKGDDSEVNLKILKVSYVPTDDNNGEFGETMVDNTTFSSDDYSTAYPTISIDGNYMIFSSDMPGGFGGLDLYVAENVGGMWSNPINLGEVINSPGNDAFPQIMDNGTLYFASDGHLGLGGYDLFEAQLLENGSFAEPINLRSPINSNFDDFGIWMNENYSGGYFTSNRPSDFGNDDIYSFTREAFIFEAIVYDSKTNELLQDAEVLLTNLESGTVLTLMTDENGYVTSDIVPNSRYSLNVAKEEYLPESAEFATTEDNVYAEIPLVKDYGIVLDVTVVDADTKEEIPYSQVKLINLKTEELADVVTNQYGKTSFVIDPDSEYKIRAAKDDLDDPQFVYLAVSKEFNSYGVVAPAQLYTVIELKKQPINTEIVIEDILYDLDKYFIRPDAALILDNLVKVLVDNPTIEIELASHTDCRASQAYNLKLSANRAKAAVNYLIENGIDYRRLTAAGYGETKPLLVKGTTDLYCTCENGGPGRSDSRCTEAVHQLNRRTAFTITKI